MNYYNVLLSNDYAKKKGVFGLAETQPEADNLYLISDNEDFPSDEIDKYRFYLENGIYADWQMCIYPWRLISKRFKEILEKHGNNQGYFFYPVKLYSSIESTHYQEYYILHFSKTIGFNNDQFQKNINKFYTINFQSFDDSITGTFFISEALKEELRDNKLTGISFDALKTIKETQYHNQPNTLESKKPLIRRIMLWSLAIVIFVNISISVIIGLDPSVSSLQFLYWSNILLLCISSVGFLLTAPLYLFIIWRERIKR